LPLQIAIWGTALGYSITIVSSHFNAMAISAIIRPLRLTFIVVCISWLAVRWVKWCFLNIHKRSGKVGVSIGTVHALNKLFTFLVIIIALMVIFQIFGVNVIPLLAFGGIGIAGLAFAAQDVIANFFGGAMLHFTQSFYVGEMVAIPSQNNFEGTIEEIGWYITVIRDTEMRPVYFPNALFSKMNVVNVSRRSHRRIIETVSIRMEDIGKIEEIVQDVRKKVGEHPEIDEKNNMSVVVNKFGDYGVEIYLNLLTHAVGFHDFLRVKQDILLITYEVIKAHGAELASPVQTIHLAEIP
jgi:MscS family membrane protein